MASKQEKTPVEDILSLLQEYEEYKDKFPPRKDLILVLGNTGSGKTTLTKLLTSLEDLETYEQNFERLIKDVNGHKISEDSTIISKTIFPDLQVDKSAPATFCDLPGFCDTRNPAIELANAFLIHDVTQNASRVKILLVANHNSLREGQYRRDFIDFLKQVADVIRSPKKFAGAFCLVATKVDMTSETLIPAMAQFLQNLRQNLPLVMEDVGHHEKVSAIIDALLSKDASGNYIRLGYVCRPTIPGRLANSPEYTVQLDSLRKVIHYNCNYAKATPNDFGTSVSPEGKMFVQSVASEISSLITQILTVVGKMLKVALRERVQTSPVSSVREHIRGLRHFQGFQQVLTKEKTRQNFLRVLRTMLERKAIKSLEINTKMEEIERKEERLRFLEEIHGKEFDFPRQDWIYPFKKCILAYERSVSDLAKKFTQLMSQKIEELGQKVIHSIPSEPRGRETAVALVVMAKGVVEDAIRHIGRASTVEEIIRVLVITAVDLEVTPFDVRELQGEKSGEDLALDGLGPDKDVWLNIWTQPLKDVCRALDSLEQTETFRAEMEKREKRTEGLERRLEDMERDKRWLERRLLEKERETERIVERLEAAMEWREHDLERIQDRLEQQMEEAGDLRRQLRRLEEDDKQRPDCTIQ